MEKKKRKQFLNVLYTNKYVFVSFFFLLKKSKIQIDIYNSNRIEPKKKEKILKIRRF